MKSKLGAMEPRQSFIAELVLLVVDLTVLVLRFGVTHQQRRREDLIRDIFFNTGAVLCLATTSCLVWYCWKSMEVYQYAAVVVDQKMAAQASTRMTDAQLAEQRESSIDLMAAAMLLDPWHRRVLI